MIPFKTSEVVAGCMNWGRWGSDLSVTATQKLIEECLDLDVTTFDHADIYGDYTTENLFGRALKKRSSLRNDMQLITKCGIQLVTPNRPENTIKYYNVSKPYIIESVEQSLRNFNTDYIDMFLIHRPSPLMNPYEIAEAFTQLKAEGKVLYFGVSNFTTSQYTMLSSLFPLVTNQIELSALHLEPFIDGTLDQCLQEKIRPMAYSVLAGGSFFAKEKKPRVARIYDVAQHLAKDYSTTVDQILIAWLFKHPSNIIPIVGSTKINRIEMAVNAHALTLQDDEWFKIWEASTGEEVA
ncbi:aldo/keto reductase family oxidoreductase [Aquimarina sp. W85]|uniref:aldo/keto reductase n=1 Tax=Aquimarina rhodophyticola TaxID=3342246 RepID=UPI00366E6F55